MKSIQLKDADSVAATEGAAAAQPVPESFNSFYQEFVGCSNAEQSWEAAHAQRYYSRPFLFTGAFAKAMLASASSLAAVLAVGVALTEDTSSQPIYTFRDPSTPESGANLKAETTTASEERSLSGVLPAPTTVEFSRSRSVSPGLVAAALPPTAPTLLPTPEPSSPALQPQPAVQSAAANAATPIANPPEAPAQVESRSGLPNLRLQPAAFLEEMLAPFDGDADRVSREPLLEAPAPSAEPAASEQPASAAAPTINGYSMAAPEASEPTFNRSAAPPSEAQARTAAQPAANLQGINDFLNLRKQVNDDRTTALPLTEQAVREIATVNQLKSFRVLQLPADRYEQAWQRVSDNKGAAPSFGFIDYQQQAVVLPLQ